jgi:ABC-type transporter Mla subunit MlaD
MRMLIRLVTLALAGYGAWSLYERYGSQTRELEPPVREFSDRATAAAKDAAENVGRSAQDAASAVGDATSELQRAARDLADETGRRLSSGTPSSGN